MFDPIVDSVIGQAIGMVRWGGLTRMRTVLFVHSLEQATPDEWARVPRSDVVENGAGSSGSIYLALRWLVSRRVLLRHPARDGRGGACLYRLNPAIETWDVAWTRPAPARRLILRAAEANAESALDQLLGAVDRATSPSDGAVRRPNRAKKRLSMVEVARFGDDAAPSCPPKMRGGPRQVPRSSSLVVGRHANGEKPSSSSGGRGGANLDLSKPGARRLRDAIRARLAVPTARIYGRPARFLEELLAVVDEELLVRAVDLADFAGGVPQLIDALPDALEVVAMPTPDLDWTEPAPGARDPGDSDDDKPEPDLPMAEQLARVRALKASRRQNGHVEVQA